MGVGSSHCRQCQQDVDSYGNVQVEHKLFCDLWYKANRIWFEPDLDGLYDMSQPDMDRMYELEQTIEGQNRTIKDLRSQIGSNVASKWKLNQEIIRLKNQNEDFRKANKDLARKNKSLQVTIQNERKVMNQSHQDLRNSIYAYEDELDQANGKMILAAEKIQNQRNQLRNLNQKQEKLVLRSVFKHIFSFSKPASLVGSIDISSGHDSRVCLKIVKVKLK